MGVFTKAELEFLQGERRLARIATVGRDGTPHVTPVGWSVDVEQGVIEVRGMDLTNTKKFRDVSRSKRAAIVIDEVLPPWCPRGVEVRGQAEAITDPEPCIRIHADRIIGWGLDDPRPGHQNARNS